MQFCMYTHACVYICPYQFQHSGSDKIFAMEVKSKSPCLTLQDIWSGNQRLCCFRKQRYFRKLDASSRQALLFWAKALNHPSADRCAQRESSVVYLHVLCIFCSLFTLNATKHLEKHATDVILCCG